MNTTTTHRHIHGVRYNAGKLYVFFGDSAGDGIWVSSDNGATLQPLCTDYACTTIDAAFDPADTFMLYGTDNFTRQNWIAKVSLSTGARTLITKIPYDSFSSIRLDAEHLSGRHHARVRGAVVDPNLHLYASVDGGATFTDVFQKPIPYHERTRRHAGAVRLPERRLPDPGRRLRHDRRPPRPGHGAGCSNGRRRHCRERLGRRQRTAPGSNGGSAITEYVVTPYIGAVAQTATTVGNVTSTTITGLTNSTTYTFKVAAKNAVGTGTQSTASNAVTPAMVPGAPTGVAATAGDASAGVSWTAPGSNGGSAITQYVVTPYIGAVAQTATTVGNVTSTTITGLTNNTTYTFKIAAKNAVGTGTQSTASNAVTPLATGGGGSGGGGAAAVGRPGP